MNEPTRLRDAQDPELRELMRYTKAEGRLTPAEVEALTSRVLAELAVGASLPSATATVPARFALAAKVAATGALAAGLTVAALVLQRTPSPRTTAPQKTPPAAKASAVDPPRVPDPPPPTAATTPDPPRAEPPKPRSVRRQPAPPLTPETQPPRIGEIELLKRVRQRLPGDPRGALEVLAQHERDYPAGIFAEEREVLAIEALWRTGHTEPARQRLQMLRARYPKSVYRERLEALLAHGPG